jgi:hypothetical protein
MTNHRSFAIATIRTKKRKAHAQLISAFVIVVLTLGGRFADTALNGDDVMKHLKAGSSPRDLADTMSIPSTG